MTLSKLSLLCALTMVASLQAFLRVAPRNTVADRPRP